VLWQGVAHRIWQLSIAAIRHRLSCLGAAKCAAVE
jgi:hypothetical protein